MGEQVAGAAGAAGEAGAADAQYEFNLIQYQIMENQLKERILSQRLSEISLAESIEVSPTKPIPRIRPPSSFPQIKRLCLAALALSFILYRLGFRLPSVGCLTDLTHKFTQSLNSLANESSLFYNIISIASQEAIEMEILMLTLLAVARMQNMTVHMFVAVFYGVRAFHLQIEKLPFPQGMVSYYPVFPCFSVPYGITRDFFYSGHTGLMLFSALFWRRIKYRRMEVATYALMVLVVLVLLITRVHYVIDVIGGAIFTLWIDRFLLPKVVWFDYVFTAIYNGIDQTFCILRKSCS